MRDVTIRRVNSCDPNDPENKWKDDEAIPRRKRSVQTNVSSFQREIKRKKRARISQKITSAMN